jgi:hypothetical protein
MTTAPKSKLKHVSAADTTAAVDAFLAQVEHPFKDEIQAIRAAILEASPEIGEGVKWNAPSYRTHEYFATTNLRVKGGIGVILHLGAKVKDLPGGGIQVSDPAGLLRWLAADRASVSFNSMQDFQSKRAAFVELIRCWVKHV